MYWKWADRIEPRPNIRRHPLDAYETQLRGDVDETDYEQPEAVIVILFAAFVIGGIVGCIVAVTT